MRDIGRQSPGWTPRQRDALHAQYGGHCGFGRCDGPIDVIHIIHWLHGGKTRITNGFPCCLYHHWLIHEGGWRISKRSDGTITTIPHPPAGNPAPSTATANPSPNAPARPTRHRRVSLRRGMRAISPHRLYGQCRQRG
jgi:hypothetical protein